MVTWSPNPGACIKGLWAGLGRAIMGKTLDDLGSKASEIRMKL